MYQVICSVQDLGQFLVKLLTSSGAAGVVRFLERFLCRLPVSETILRFLALMTSQWLLRS